jgi:hypothetical protein
MCGQNQTHPGCPAALGSALVAIRGADSGGAPGLSLVVHRAATRENQAQLQTVVLIIYEFVNPDSVMWTLQWVVVVRVATKRLLLEHGRRVSRKLHQMLPDLVRK